MKTPITLLTALVFCLAANAQEDHSEFIEGPFSSPQEVTETCLLCHDGVDKDLMKTRHWDWLGENKIGKQNLINSFCVSLPANWPRCTSCHIGYGWKDDTFDFEDPNNIDCLVCHDRSGTYMKTPTGAGMPDPSVDLLKVAQSVGKTTNRSCATCHFNGGGGSGVKHGDLTASMGNPAPSLDYHMGELGFSCSDCHAGEKHQILGASHGSIATGEHHMSCLDCHTDTPHERKIVNNHVASIACETCHIPAFAREEPTQIWWDWSTAGQDLDPGTDDFGKPVYDKKKGDFTWEKNVIPEYRWYNGQADYHRFGDKIDPGNIVDINRLSGSIYDENAKITPFKMMRGKQIYDTKNRYLITPKMFGEGGYWSDFSWDKAARLGMAASGLEYSGSYDFVETRMYWPVNHMVAPAEKSLKCTACHTRKDNKRLDWKKLGYKGDPMTVGGRAK